MSTLAQRKLEKAEQTAAAVAAIIAEEQKGAEAKVARLKALRLGRVDMTPGRVDDETR